MPPRTHADTIYHWSLLTMLVLEDCVVIFPVTELPSWILIGVLDGGTLGFLLSIVVVIPVSLPLVLWVSDGCWEGK